MSQKNNIDKILYIYIYLHINIYIKTVQHTGNISFNPEVTNMTKSEVKQPLNQCSSLTTPPFVPSVR